MNVANMAASLSTSTLPTGDHFVNAFTTGTVFGPYTLIRRLGKGGMATVWLAKKKGVDGFERQVAVKVVHPDISSDPEQIEQLRLEARVCGRLHHPNVVAVNAFDLYNDRHYLAMEYIDGWSLEEILSRINNPIPFKVTLEIMIAVCKGLAYAHDVKEHGEPLNLVHRDLKPGNIMIGRQGEVKVMDFGIVKSSNANHQTEAGMTKGTVIYMSPEQVLGQELDRRSDIFALGSIFFELLTGNVLFQASTQLLLLESIGRLDETELDRRIRSQCRSRGISTVSILTSCLKKERGERYETAGEMLAELALLHESTSGPSLETWLQWLDPDKPTSGASPQGADSIPNLTGSALDSIVEPVVDPLAETLSASPATTPAPAPGIEPVPNKTVRVGPHVTAAPARPKKPDRRFAVAMLATLLLAASLSIWHLVRPANAVLASPTPTPEAQILASDLADLFIETEVTPTPDPTPESAVEATPQPTPVPKRIRTPAPTPQPTPAPTAQVVREPGTLKVRIAPWVVVYVDGDRVGQGLRVDHELAPGTYVIKAVCGGDCENATKTEEEWTVTILSDQDHLIRENWRTRN